MLLFIVYSVKYSVLYSVTVVVVLLLFSVVWLVPHVLQLTTCVTTLPEFVTARNHSCLCTQVYVFAFYNTDTRSKLPTTQSARDINYSSLYHTISGGISSGMASLGISGSGGIANPLLDCEASIHGGSVHNSTIQGIYNLMCFSLLLCNTFYTCFLWCNLCS
jgi:hypothetical protein